MVSFPVSNCCLQLCIFKRSQRNQTDLKYSPTLEGLTLDSLPKNQDCIVNTQKNTWRAFPHLEVAHVNKHVVPHLLPLEMINTTADEIDNTIGPIIATVLEPMTLKKVYEEIGRTNFQTNMNWGVIAFRIVAEVLVLIPLLSGGLSTGAPLPPPSTRSKQARGTS